MIEIASIKIGTIFTNAELMEKFGVSNSGGMRRSLKNNLLILIHKKDSVYQDRWQDDKLFYTGMGLKGDQDIDFGQNKTLAQSRTNGVTMLLFNNPKSNVYEYEGEVVLAGTPFYEKQYDEGNQVRQVVMFPLAFKS